MEVGPGGSQRACDRVGSVSPLTRLSWRSVLARHGLSPGPRPGPAGVGGRLPTLRKVRGVRGDREHCRAGVVDSCVVCWLSLRTAADGHKAAAESLLRSAVPTDPCKISGRKVCVCCWFLINEKETTQRVPHSIQWESDGSRGFMKGALFSFRRLTPTEGSTRGLEGAGAGRPLASCLGAALG